jgi:hypothetical protein
MEPHGSRQFAGLFPAGARNDRIGARAPHRRVDRIRVDPVGQSLESTPSESRSRRARSTIPGACPPYGATGVLFVESANCTYTGTGGQPWGGDATPVMLIIANGTLTFGANVNCTGIIYMVNGQGTTPAPGQQCSAGDEITWLSGANLYWGVV